MGSSLQAHPQHTWQLIHDPKSWIKYWCKLYALTALVHHKTNSCVYIVHRFTIVLFWYSSWQCYCCCLPPLRLIDWANHLFFGQFILQRYWLIETQLIQTHTKGSNEYCIALNVSIQCNRNIVAWLLPSSLLLHLLTFWSNCTISRSMRWVGETLMLLLQAMISIHSLTRLMHLRRCYVWGGEHVGDGDVIGVIGVIGVGWW